MAYELRSRKSLSPATTTAATTGSPRACPCIKPLSASSTSSGISKKKRPSTSTSTSTGTRTSTKPPPRRPQPPRSDRAQKLLAHAYDAVVSPVIANIKRAKHIDSQTTYGEQSPSFISAMLNEFQVSSTSSFVDLGSGVGNVVLQAYLESGCQALGCELDVERHQAATALQRAVEAALSLPPKGISSRDMGTTAELQRAVSLVQGDIFVERETVTRVRTADLIFCDNIKFGPELVRRQVDAVLEQMKSWSVLVSLERVVRGTRKYCRETLSRCGVTEERRVSERGAVSWTDKPIEYWIYRKQI